MKKLTLGLLTFLTFLPSLVCFMAVCPMTSAQASEAMPCHDAKNEDGKPNVDRFMLVQDCMGVDFFQQNVDQARSPDFTFTDIDFVWTDLAVIHSFEPNSMRTIRGPPPLLYSSTSEIPLYLSTQRFRI